MLAPMVRRVLLGWAMGSLLLPLATATPLPLRVCVVDLDAPPYAVVDPLRRGLVERLMVDAGRPAGLDVQLQRAPAQRCQALLQNGAIESIVAGPAARNLELGRFPMKGGAIDEGRRLAVAQLFWVKRRDSPVDWDGQRLSGAAPAELLAGARPGVFIAIEKLQALGLRIDAAGVGTPQLLAKLRARRVDLAVAFEHELQLLLREPVNAELAMLSRPFAMASFYAMVRPGLAAATMERVERWWTEIGRLRDQPAYRPSGAGSASTP